MNYFTIKNRNFKKPITVTIRSYTSAVSGTGSSGNMKAQASISINGTLVATNQSGWNSYQWGTPAETYYLLTIQPGETVNITGTHRSDGSNSGTVISRGYLYIDGELVSSNESSGGWAATTYTSYQITN